MTRPRTTTEDLLRQLGASAAPVEEPERTAARRARVVPVLERVVVDAHRRRVRRVRYARILGAAAAVIILVGISYVARRSPAQSATGVQPNAVLALSGSVGKFVRGGKEVAAPPLRDVAMEQADEVVTAEGALARASLASGAEVEIGPASRVKLFGGDGPGGAGAAGEAVDFAMGRVTVRVPKLGPSRSFSVRTPDAVVVVHGTVFSVERQRDVVSGLSATKVAVEQGSVAVRRGGIEVLLQGGDRWSSAPTPTPPTEGTPTVPTEESDATVRSGQASREPAAADDKVSSLGAENKLLKAAMAAREGGDPRRALSLSDDFLTRFGDHRSPKKPAWSGCALSRRSGAPLRRQPMRAATSRTFRGGSPAGKRPGSLRRRRADPNGSYRFELLPDEGSFGFLVP